MATNDANRTADELKAEIDRLRADVSDMMDTLGRLAEKGKEEGAESLRAARDKVTEGASRAVKTAEAQIVERPFVSVLAAFGTGMLIGRLLDRR